MPVCWNIDHSQRFVEVVAEGHCEAREFVTMLDAVEAEGAVPYRKLIDVVRLTGPLSGENLSAVAERVGRLRDAGPIAAVVPSGPADGLARLFVLLADAQGRARVFRVEAVARGWLGLLPQ